MSHPEVFPEAGEGPAPAFSRMLQSETSFEKPPVYGSVLIAVAVPDLRPWSLTLPLNAVAAAGTRARARENHDLCRSRM